MTRKETREEKIAAVKSWLPALKERFPLTKPFYIRYVEESHPEEDHGGCGISRSGKSFIITLNLRNDIANLLDPWLIHEWTHARMWEHHTDCEVHPPEFWTQFGRIRNFCIDYNFTEPTITVVTETSTEAP